MSLDSRAGTEDFEFGDMTVLSVDHQSLAVSVSALRLSAILS